MEARWCTTGGNELRSPSPFPFARWIEDEDRLREEDNRETGLLKSKSKVEGGKRLFCPSPTSLSFFSPKGILVLSLGFLFRVKGLGADSPGVTQVLGLV